MTDQSQDLCSNQTLTDLVARIEQDERSGIIAVETALQHHPRDPRLLFLHGSLLAGIQRYPDAISAITRAVDLAPDYRIARFQLGFLHFTSGDAAAAISVWQPLDPATPIDALAYFARGLEHLAQDDFDTVLHFLQRGMAINDAHPLLNGDMQKIMDEVGRLPKDTPDPPVTTDSAHVLLQQYSAGKFTKH